MKKKEKNKGCVDYESLDAGIRGAVLLLNSFGFKTYESCEGGIGHCVQDAFVSFEGDEYDLLRAFEICRLHGLNVHEALRVFSRTDYCKNNDSINGKFIGETWDKPYNRLVFLKHSQTGTIYLPR